MHPMPFDVIEAMAGSHRHSREQIAATVRLRRRRQPRRAAGLPAVPRWQGALGRSLVTIGARLQRQPLRPRRSPA